jgi:glycosyltransferase involved in cell wall biosynthesis
MRRVLMMIDGPLLSDVCIGKEAQTLVRAGYQVVILADKAVTRQVYGYNPTSYKGFEIKYYKTKSFKSLVIPDVKFLLQCVREFKPDIIHVQNSLLSPYGLLASKVAKVPLLLYLHDVSTLLVASLPYNMAAKTVAASYHFLTESYPIHAANQIVTNTAEMKQIISKMYFVRNTKMDVVFNTPSINEFVDVSPIPDPRLEDRFVIAYTGSIDPFRNLKEVVSSMKSVKSPVKPLLLIIGGAPSGYDWCVTELRKFVAKEGLDEMVFVCGKLPRQTTLQYIAASDVCVVAHKINSYTNLVNPTKIHEYAALGKAIISTPLSAVITQYGNSITIWDGTSAKALAELL